MSFIGRFGRILLPCIIIAVGVLMHDSYFTEATPAVTREFQSWVRELEDKQRQNTLPEDLTVKVEFRVGDETKYWHFNSLQQESSELLMRVLQLTKEAGLIRPYDEEIQSATVSDYLSIEASTEKHFFETIVPLEDLRHNVQAKNLLVLLEHRA